MISVADIEQRLRDRVEMLAGELLPAARREGNYLKVGSVQGEAGQSLAIELAGAGKGWWRDYAGTDHGDMLDLIRVTRGLASKGDAVAWAKAWLGIDDSWERGKPPAKANPDEQRKRAEEARARAEQRQAREAAERAQKIKRARGLFLGGPNDPTPGIKGTPVELYLRGRGLEPGEAGEWPRSLRFHAEVWCREERCKIPAMLAMIVTADGEHVATHRTYLMERRGQWTKIDSPNSKMVLGPMGGGFVPIAKGASGKPMARIPQGEPVYVAEGIEDCLVLRMKKPEARIVAAISLGNLAAMVLPAAARRLVICADRDDNAKAVDQLERAIAAQQARGIEVRLVMPPVGHKDLNDWLRAEQRQRGAA